MNFQNISMVHVYETIMRASAWLTRDVKECEKQFRAAIFNIFSHNRDDHAKNFSFLMSKENVWRVAPAYDLTFSSGPGGEHCSMVMGEGKSPTRDHLLKLAEIAAISQQKAEQIIDEVGNAASKWQSFAKEAEVSAASTKMVQLALNQVAKGLLR